jgi:predicted DNA binding CopG/RHH family protein
MSRAREYAESVGYEIEEETTAEFKKKLRASKDVSITIRVPEEVIEEYKNIAGENASYQVLMREVLINSLKKTKPS